MVVLDVGGMPTSGNNQYLQPDYLSPLPTMLDAKKSPLAMLVQTCSQIGADSPTKPLIMPLEKSSKTMSGPNGRSPPAAATAASTNKSERSYTNPSEPKPLGFKPYEPNPLSKKCVANDDNNRPTSKTSVHSVSGMSQDCATSVTSDNNNVEKKSMDIMNHHVGRKSVSPNNHHNRVCNNTTTSSITTMSGVGSPSDDRTTPQRCSYDREKTNDSPRNNCDASPIVRSGMEMLSSVGGVHPKDFASYKPQSGFGVFGGGNPMCCPPGMAENPAFRPPFAGASPFSHHHAAAAAALLGYPTATPTTASLYLSYARVKTPSGGEALVPVCKDPYCTGCQYSMHNAQMMMGAGTCPSGCTQCDHQKYGLAMALSSLGPMAPPPPSIGYPSLTNNGSRPYVCNWIVGDAYCGKRFNTSEELLQHLRSHTSMATGNDNNGSGMMTAGGGGGGGTTAHSSHPLLSPSAAIHRAAGGSSYPPPSLSPLGGRYHPYGKPPTGPLPASLAASPYSAFNTLGPYYSPYAIYGQRLGAAAVHP